MNTILSICIPTYNRAKILKQNLENLINRVSIYKIPIYVSDNSSPDNTSEVVESCQKSYEHIYYSRNEENYGPARNFEIALNMCESRYAWLLSDDDTIIGDLQPLLDIIEYKEWNFVVLGIHDIKKNRNSKEYHNIHNIFNDLLGTMTWISTLVVNKSFVKKMLLVNHPNPHFAHTGALIESLDHDFPNVYYYNSTPVVAAMNREVCDWASRAFEIFTEQWIDFVLSLPDYYTLNEKNRVIASLPGPPWRWRLLILYRSLGFFDFQRLMKQGKKIWQVSKVHFVVMSMIAVMPTLFAQHILKFGLKLKSILRAIIKEYIF